MISNTPQPPYYAVIFSSIRSENDNGYTKMSDKMINLAKQQSGFLGIESVRNDLGITISYWKDLNSIQMWKENAEHKTAQKLGRSSWYKSFKVRIAKVEKDYGFGLT